MTWCLTDEQHRALLMAAAKYEAIVLQDVKYHTKEFMDVLRAMNAAGIALDRAGEGG